MADRMNRAFPLTPADDICISGMGGRFPKATGLYELRDKLYNKVKDRRMLSGAKKYSLKQVIKLYFLNSVFPYENTM